MVKIALTTTWTAIDDVTQTATTLSNIEDVLTQVGYKVGRGTLSATSVPASGTVANFAVKAKELLTQYLNPDTNRSVRQTTTVGGTYRLALPGDFLEEDVSLVDKTNNRKIIKIPASVYDMKYPDPSEETSDESLWYCIKGGKELWLAPPPAGGSTLELGYIRSAVDTNPYDISYFPEPLRWLIVDITLVETFEHLHDYERAGYHRQAVSEDMMALKRRMKKRMWKNAGYRIHSLLEENLLRNYQDNA